ncbi:MAG: phosphatidylglycerol lysyltransferase [Treponema sp.]|jgi:phosphoglucomutase|nr:phosphatidylglycerol lysyltransferase [Treponema sp.]
MARDSEGRVTEEELDRALEGMILSASGWRGVFALDGNGESRAAAISPAHRLIAAAAARVFADWLKASSGNKAPLVLVGTDTRPTGPAIAGVVVSAFRASGCPVSYAGILAAPEIMAWARSHVGAAGFIYISASHNPIGHNGIKFGLTDGGVLPGPQAALLIDAFKALTASPQHRGASGAPEGRVGRLLSLLKAPSGPPSGTFFEVPGAAQAEGADKGAAKSEAYRAYFDFSARVVYGGSALREALARGLAERPLGIVCDFNGSARAASIDREFLTGAGLRFRGMNEGEIVHRIVPEGESLEPCRRFLEACHREDPCFVMGYLPDCDGDRGNLVIWDDAAKKARRLEAQEVFALCCVAELAHLEWTGELGTQKAALAVNDPTSLRVDRIAGAFGVEVFRAEVGEANVVGLARNLRDRGYTVRILGEGSAGGNITHPSAVRDPLDTLFSLLKLLRVRDGPDGRGFFSIWLSRLGRPGVREFGLSALIDSLPPFVTTGAYEAEAILKVKTRDHGELKARYQTVFLREWEKRRDELRHSYGVVSWEAAAYNGMEERRGIEKFGDAGRGGLKLCFLNGQGQAVAAIWMRGSATEPVFRVMADAEGPEPDFERDLISWQRRMVAEADMADH